MQSDQKIGLCLLIGLFGFAAALGVGRRERQATPVVEATALAPADDLFPIATEVESTDKTADQLPTVELVAPESTVREISVSETITPVALGEEPIVPVVDPQAAVQSVGGPKEHAGTRSGDDSPIPTANSESHAAYVEYVVRSGDTLSGIAARQLGDGLRYFDVFQANTDLLAHPDALRVGQTIRIPIDRRRELQTATSDSMMIR